MDIREAISRNVKALREELNLSQSDLADKAGLSRFVIIKVENEKSVTLETIERIAKACNVNPSCLLEASGVQRSKQLHTKLENNDSVINIDHYNMAFINLPEYVQQLAKVLSVNLSQYFAPDNVRRELKVNRESTIMGIVQMMNNPKYRDTIRYMDGEGTTDFWVERFTGLVSSFVRS